MSINLSQKIVFAGILGLAASGSANAAEHSGTEDASKRATAEKPLIDKSKWQCKFCPDNAEELWYSEIDIGLGYVSNESFKFGEYSGLNDDGAFLQLDIDLMYRDEDANYFDIQADNLGLDSHRIDLEGGKQGGYKIYATLDQITKSNLDTARTPYSGTTSQSLSDNWITAANTAAMTGLLTDLRDINFNTERRRVSVGGNIIQDSHWNYTVNVDHQTKQGQTPFAAAIGSTFADTRSAIIAKPIDYITDRFELAANYKHNDLNGQFLFITSTFKNENAALNWQNAFSTGAGAGQSSLEPDNEMLQLMTHGQYRGFENVLVNGLISVSKLTQNDRFLPYTVNGILNPPALPENSLDGSVDVANANAAVIWTISDKTRIKFAYEYHEQVDDTDRSSFTYVIADNSITGAPRANFPYDFRNQKLSADTRHILDENSKILGGIDFGLKDRTFQEVDQSRETSIWAKYIKSLPSNVNYSLRLERFSRFADSYDVLSEVVPAENPQLRKFNLADNRAYKAAFNIDFPATEMLYLNFAVDIANNDFHKSDVGLTESDDLNIGIDALYSVDENFTLSGYISRSVISSSQSGSSSAGDADWKADIEDTILTLGVGIDHRLFRDDLSIGLEIVHTNATGDITLSGPANPLPDLVTKRNSITVYADYQYNENLTYKLSYLYEDYKEKNWNLDDVTPSTIDNVLSLGETSPDYEIGLIWLSLKYVF